MKKSCNRCRAFCTSFYNDQGCGLGYKTKLISGVPSTTPMCHIVIIGPDEECSPVKNIMESIRRGVSTSKVTRWWNWLDVERQQKQSRLTIVEPDTTASQPINPESGAG